MSFQSRVWRWAKECFVTDDALSPEQRSFRFMEEALELTQAVGTSKEDVHRLVDHVYSRPVGEARQEVGGVMVTLAALCESKGIIMLAAAHNEIARCERRTAAIREKDRAKPKRSPLAVGGEPHD